MAGFELSTEEKEPFCQKVLRQNFPNVPVYDDVRSFNATLSRAGFRARTFRMLEREQALEANEAASGKSSWKPFAWYDQGSQSWKTFQLSASGEWEPFSETWPKMGMTRNGIAYRPESSAHHTAGNAYSWLPTPTRSDAEGGWMPMNPDRRMQQKVKAELYCRLCLPTIGANEFKGSSKNRYKGSEHFRGARSKDVRRVEDLLGRSDLPEPLVRGARNGIPNRVDRIKALGNAVVPQCAEFIAMRLRDLDSPYTLS